MFTYKTISTKFGHILPIKKYLKIVASTIVLFIGYHAAIWFFFTSGLLAVAPSYHIGDLARIGYLPSSVHLRKNITDLPKTHYEFSTWKGEPIDIVTIGDSFSNGGAGGKNPFYQDYIASRYHCNVLNINPSLFGENYIEAVVALFNSGVLKSIRPKFVLIESIERSAVGRFSGSMEWDRNVTRKLLLNDLKNGQWGDGKPSEQKHSFITTANYKLPLYNFYYLFSPNALGYSGSFKFRLTTPLFNAKADSTLLAYKQDITSIPGNTEENILKLNDNFNHLAKMLKSNNIQLMMMIAVDKYDLYYDYIQDNTYEKNHFFDLLGPLGKNYTFIDTKAILAEELKKGKKDIYFADDTHWSNLASEAIVRDHNFR